MVNISGKTTVCGIIGDPIEHTISPVIHNAAFSYLNLDYVYVPFHVRPEEIAGALEGIRALNVRGLNVTIPHKISVIPQLDEIDPLAKQIGAINTIVNSRGNLKGYNTDGLGFLRSLLENGIDPKGKNFVVLGAGGVSRAICFTLAARGANITILNRLLELEWAVELAEQINHNFHLNVLAAELNDKNLKEVMENADVLTNATSVGMSPDCKSSPIEPRWLKPDILVYDVIYNPVETRLLKEARQIGSRTINGLDMLIWQGAMSFEYWTGQEAPVAVMKDSALRAMSTMTSRG